MDQGSIAHQISAKRFANEWAKRAIMAERDIDKVKSLAAMLIDVITNKEEMFMQMLSGRDTEKLKANPAELVRQTLERPNQP